MIALKKSLLSKVNLVHYLFLFASLFITLTSSFIFYNLYQRSSLIKKDMERVKAAQGLIYDIQKGKDILHTYTLTPDAAYIMEFMTSLQGIQRKAASYREDIAAMKDEMHEEIELITTVEKTLVRIMDEVNSIKGKVPLDVRWVLDIEKGISSIVFQMDRLISISMKRISLYTEKTLMWLISIVVFYFIISIIGTILIVIAHYANIRYVLRPISNLIKAANSFIRGERGIRVRVASADEMGELSAAFNQMAETIETKEKALIQLNQSLEERVRERTRELEDACDKLKKAQDKLLFTERLAIAGKVSSRVAHSILTPLSSFAVNLEVLQRCLGRSRCASNGEDCNKSFKVMQEELQRISSLVKSYIRFSKPPSPQKKEVVRIEGIIDEAILLFFNKAEKAGVKIEKSYGDTPEVYVDRGQMREVFLNLGNNAIEAMEQGGVVSFVTLNSDDMVTVKVSDNGPGIDEETMKNLFMPFNSTKSQGLGLGLNIVRHIVESHGGGITCESTLDAGTTFSILLPVYHERE